MFHKMIRSFLPVGQGAFYVEQFCGGTSDGVNVVYDCGSLTDVEIVKKEIRSVFSKHEEIRAVFISHVDADHVNGLEYLLGYCKVKRVYLPLLTEDEKVLTRIIFEIEHTATSFMFNLLVNSAEAIREASSFDGYDGAVTFYIKSEDMDNLSNTQNKDNDTEEISSGQPVEGIFLDSKKSGKDDWIYVPFNFKRTARFSKLVLELNSLGISLADMNDAVFVNSNLDNIKKAYEKVPGKLNVNSLVLYSGPSDNKCQLKYIATSDPTHWARFPNYQYLGKAGCLYTGDYNASGAQRWGELMAKYSPYLRNIGTIQIPHHGSRKSYNTLFTKMDCILIISAGCNNSYRHPHTSVLKDIITSHSQYFWITEHSGSKVIFKIDS